MSLKVRDIQVWQPSMTLGLVPVAIMISHMVVSGYLDHQSTQFRLSASERLLFVFVVLVLINALYGIPNCNGFRFEVDIYIRLSWTFSVTQSKGHSSLATFYSTGFDTCGYNDKQ